MERLIGLHCHQRESDDWDAKVKIGRRGLHVGPAPSGSCVLSSKVFAYKMGHGTGGMARHPAEPRDPPLSCPYGCSILFGVPSSATLAREMARFLGRES